MAQINEIYRGMQNGAETINDNLEAINSELTSGGNVVHKTGDETIAGKKTFTGNVEVNGSLTLPTKSWSGELGGGITISLRKKGTTVEYSIGGEISSNILANSNLVNLSVPNEFCPRNRCSLVGHIAGGWNAFHIDIPSSGVCQWFGPTVSSGTPRGTGTYPID